MFGGGRRLCRGLELVLLHTVDFAIAASKDGFSPYKLFHHMKTEIVQKMTKNIRFLFLSYRCNTHRY
jgi:hypothetical protein